MPFDLIRKNHPGSRHSIKHAEAALPILVYYATVLKRAITYTELAAFLKTYRRVLGKPLWVIGLELEDLRQRWHEKRIPMIQFLITKQGSGLPGVGGLNWLIRELFDGKRKSLTRDQQLSAVETYRETIFKYDKWDKVLQEFKLKPYRPPMPDLKTATEQLSKKYGHGKGESMAHCRLKYCVSQNPARVGLPKQSVLQCVEFEYPSMDRAERPIS